MTASKDIVVSNDKGFHARPVMQFADVANSFTAEIVVKKLTGSPAEVDGKSVMHLITLEATQGTKLNITATGEDAQQAVDELEKLFEERFGED